MTVCPLTCLVPAFLMLGMLFSMQLPAFREGLQAWEHPKPTLLVKGLGRPRALCPHAYPPCKLSIFSSAQNASYLPMTSCLGGQSPGNTLGWGSKFSCGQDQTSPVLDPRPGIGQALLSKSPGEDRLTD